MSGISECFTDNFNLPDYTRCIRDQDYEHILKVICRSRIKRYFQGHLPPHTLRSTQLPSTYDFFLILKIYQGPCPNPLQSY